MEPLVIAIVVVVFLIAALVVLSNVSAEKKRKEQAERRRAVIYQKYGHTEIAEKILNQTVWVGETGEQLRDSLGAPLDIDEKVLKTKRKEIWKYVRKGANRFGYKFTLENGVVVGWDEKM